MFDDQLRSVLTDLIRTERVRRERPAKQALLEVTQRFTQAGALGHGRYPVVIDTTAAEELEFRADRWIQITLKLFEESGTAWTSATSEPVQVILEQELIRDWEELYQLVQSKKSHLTQPRVEELVKAKDRAQGTWRSEIARLVLIQDRARVPLSTRLAQPRYGGVRVSYGKARAFFDGPKPDLANAVKEVVASVEQVARLLIDEPGATLGQAIKTLRKKGQVPAPLLKGLEETWGWSSETDGVRHGADSPGGLDPAMARYAFAHAEAVMAYLLDLDAVNS